MKLSANMIRYYQSYGFRKMIDVFAAAGVVIMFWVSRWNYHHWHYYAPLALLIALGLMATIMVPGLKNMWKTINQATRWMQIGPISLQPSELCKAAVIVSFSSFAAILGKKKMHTLRWGILPFMGIIGVIAVLLYFERHLSGTLIIAAIGMMIIFLAGANMAWFFAGGGAVGVRGASASACRTDGAGRGVFGGGDLRQRLQVL